MEIERMMAIEIIIVLMWRVLHPMVMQIIMQIVMLIIQTLIQMLKKFFTHDIDNNCNGVKTVLVNGEKLR